MQAYSLASLHYRVVNRLHTTAQVQVGYCAGTANALWWHMVCEQVLNCRWAPYLGDDGKVPLLAAVAVIGLTGLVVVQKIIWAAWNKPTTGGSLSGMR